MRRIFIALVLLSSLFGTARAEVAIALVAPLTGSAASFGEQLRHGAEQAVADINAQGGVLGQKIILKQYDDACDPKQAVAAANRVANDGIKFVIGHYCSGAGLAAEKVFMENEILVISPGVGHPDFTEKADTFVFRNGLRNDYQGQTLAAYILKHFPNKNVAILNDKGAYGAMLAAATKEALNKGGKQEVLFDSYTAGERDYASIISLLKEKKADILVIGGVHTDAGLIARQLHEQKAAITVMGGVFMTSNEFWSITGSSGEGSMMVFAPDPRKRPEAKAAVASLRKSGYEPEGYTIYAYAAAQVIAQGIAATQNLDTRAVAAALRKGTYPTVIGDLHFDAKGDVQRPQLLMYKWHNGTYEQAE